MSGEVAAGADAPVAGAFTGAATCAGVPGTVSARPVSIAAGAGTAGAGAAGVAFAVGIAFADATAVAASASLAGRRKVMFTQASADPGTRTL